MELKDVILSTLAEMETGEAIKKVPSSFEEPKKIEIVKKTEVTEPTQEKLSIIEPLIKETQEESLSNEAMFLNSFRERLLVLFEGFQAPNNTNIEAKVDMTINFLEYALASIDQRVEQLEKGKLQ